MSVEVPAPARVRDELVDALDALIDALHESTRRNTLAITRAERLIEGLASGTSHRELVEDHDDELIVELTRQNFDALSDAGARVRRLQAHALNQEGLSTYRIAELFGVSRQRVSQLIEAARRDLAPTDATGHDEPPR